MGRVVSIVALVVLAMAGGVAGASSPDRVRTPVDAGTDRVTNESGTVVVERGDHLWKISARHLGENSPESEIGPYWREVIEVNLPRLRSGDPDLIFPGEVVELPERPSRARQ